MGEHSSFEQLVQARLDDFVMVTDCHELAHAGQVRL